MTQFFLFNKEFFLRVIDQSIIISNPRLRLHVEIDIKTLNMLLTHFNGLPEQEWGKMFNDCSGKDRTQRFMGVEGLVTDHSGFYENTKCTSPMLYGEELFELLCMRQVLIKHSNQARLTFKTMNNLLDQDNLGSFHQRVGQYVLLGLRSSEPWRAWQNQKFSPDGLKLVGENYLQIQEPFFDSRYTHTDMNGSRVLDFGCGNGYFSAKFSEAGATVIGIDSSEELISLAKKNYSSNSKVDFLLTKTILDSIEHLNNLNAKSINLIYLQDTLLLLLNPKDGLPSDVLSGLFQAFRRILVDGGEINAMEPNATFWLAGRYGDPKAPFAIVTEYRNHVFNVVPNLGEMIYPFANAGFGLVEYTHPKHTDPNHPDHEYAKEFPVWDFFRFKLIN